MCLFRTGSVLFSGQMDRRQWNSSNYTNDDVQLPKNHFFGELCLKPLFIVRCKKCLPHTCPLNNKRDIVCVRWLLEGSKFDIDGSQFYWESV